MIANIYAVKIGNWLDNDPISFTGTKWYWLYLRRNRVFDVLKLNLVKLKLTNKQTNKNKEMHSNSHIAVSTTIKSSENKMYNDNSVIMVLLSERHSHGTWVRRKVLVVPIHYGTVNSIVRGSRRGGKVETALVHTGTLPNNLGALSRGVKDHFDTTRTS